MAEDNPQFAEFSKKAKACDIVRFTFCDMNGIPRTCLIPGSQTPHFTRSGVTWWSGLAATGIHKKPKNCPKEVEAINHGNATAVPMPGTYYEVTWCNEENLKIGEVLILDYPSELANRGEERVWTLVVTLSCNYSVCTNS